MRHFQRKGQFLKTGSGFSVRCPRHHSCCERKSMPVAGCDFGEETDAIFIQISMVVPHSLQKITEAV